MPRSLFEFSFVMPNVRIIEHPVFPDKVKRERWWVWPGTASLLISEYNKFLLAWIRNQISVLVIHKESKNKQGPVTQSGDG